MDVSRHWTTPISKTGLKEDNHSQCSQVRQSPSQLKWNRTDTNSVNFESKTFVLPSIPFHIHWHQAALLLMKEAWYGGDTEAWIKSLSLTLTRHWLAAWPQMSQSLEALGLLICKWKTVIPGSQISLRLSVKLLALININSFFTPSLSWEILLIHQGPQKKKSPLLWHFASPFSYRINYCLLCTFHSTLIRPL